MIRWLREDTAQPRWFMFILYYCAVNSLYWSIYQIVSYYNG